MYIYTYQKTLSYMFMNINKDYIIIYMYRKIILDKYLTTLLYTCMYKYICIYIWI